GIGFMIWQSLRELKHGLALASSATKKLLEREKRKTLQGAIPGVSYVIPILSETILYFATVEEDSWTTRNEPVALVSAVIFCMVTTHTFVHSFTVLACSPNYRRTLLHNLQLLQWKLR
ncbi:hypothetical protein PFISCL1PPCAC_12761, partial [Pristionchus fissidentatus]